MLNDNTPLIHHLFQVSQIERVSQIPADTLGNNIDRVMQVTEGLSDQGHGQAT
jgi:hypothetical protein